MRKMRLLYARRRALLLDALHAEGEGLLDIDKVPEGGLRVTVSLPADVDDLRVAKRCLEAGLKVDPLSICHQRVWRRSGLIIGFASTPEEQIRPAVAMLIAVIKRVMEEQTTPA